MLALVLKLKAGWAVPGAALVGFAIGFFVGLQDSVKAFIFNASTAVIGSFILVRGVGNYAPGYPNLFGINAKAVLKDPNANLELLAYLGGFILLSIIGFIWQQKHYQQQGGEDIMHDKEGGEDDFYYAA